MALEKAKVMWEMVQQGEDGGIDANLLTMASESICTILDAFTGMGIVKSDMECNIAKIRANVTKRGGSTSLQQMIDDELKGGLPAAEAAAGGAHDATTACALTWLKRALRLVEGLLRGLVEDKTKDLGTCANDSYNVALYPYHSWAAYAGVKVRARTGQAAKGRGLARASRRMGP
jgi:hypothetical protein